MGKIIKACVAAIAAVLAVTALAVPVAAQTPGNPPKMHSHEVRTSTTNTLIVSSIPNNFSTLKLNLRAKSTDTNTASKVSYVLAQFNSDNGSNYSWGHTWWLFACCSGNSTAYAQTAGQIGQITDTASTSDPSGSGVITCTWHGYSQATWDQVGFCDSAHTETTSSTGLSRIVTSMVWRPVNPSAISSLSLTLSDGSHFEIGTILDTYLE